MSVTKVLSLVVVVAVLFLVVCHLSIADNGGKADRSAPLSSHSRRYQPSRRSSSSDSVISSAQTAEASATSRSKSKSVGKRRRNQSSVAGDLTTRIIDDGARCVNIPDNLTACRSLLGYRQMRTPDLLRLARTGGGGGFRSAVGHDDIASWLESIKTNATVEAGRQGGQTDAFLPSCSPLAGLFVCSLVAPVCLERPVLPCRSLCERVKLDCRISDDRRNTVQNLIDCDWLPTDDQLCIGRDASDGGNHTDFTSTAVGSQTMMISPDLNTSVTGAPESNNVITVVAATGSDLEDSGTLRHVESNEHVNAGSNRPVCVHPDCVVPETASDVLLDNFCAADFVAKIRPDRYITSGFDLKIVASKAIKFYKYPASTISGQSFSFPPSNHRTKWIFHVTRGSLSNCSCSRREATASNGGGSGNDESSVGAGNFVVLGRLERVGDRGRRGEHHGKPRLELSAIATFDSGSKEFRRALRAIKDADACRGAAVQRLTETSVATHVTRPMKEERRLLRKSQRRQLPSGATEKPEISYSRKEWRTNQHLNIREKNRQTKIKSKAVMQRRGPDVVQDNENERQQQRQVRKRPMRLQGQADEQTIMANRRARIERKKLLGDRPQRKPSRRNNRNEDRQRTTNS